MSLCTDTEIQLTETLQATVDEDNCTFITTDILEHADFEEWCFKNGVEYVVTTHSSQNLYDELSSDPLLNQIIIENKIIEEAPSISSGSSEDQLAEYQMLIEADTGQSIQQIHDINSVVSSIEVNDQVETEDTYEECISKSDVLIEATKSSPVTLEMMKDNHGLSFQILNSDGIELMPPHLIQVSESSNYHETISTQIVTTINLLEIAPKLEVKLLQLLTNCGAKIHLCPLNDCQKAFLQLTSAKLHALTHLGIKPYKCDIPNCPWAFYTPFKLARHKETHSKQKNFICDFPGCQRGFTTIYNLNSHKKSHEKPANLVCPVPDCDKVFQTEKERRVHCKSHNNSEAPFHCPVDRCKKSFFSQSSLQTHTRSHTHKETELICKWPNCGRAFDTAYKLKEHTRKHTGVRPYVCSYEDCTWSFPTASKLKRHQITHTNERKFHCTIGTCTKKFLRSEHLRDHTLTHIGHKSFECDTCGSTFVGKSSLYNHIKKIHPERSLINTRAAQNNNQQEDKPSAEALLEQAIQSLGVPSDMMIGTGLLPEEPLELLENENFSTVNLRDLD